jgi:hypothetical protein
MISFRHNGIVTRFRSFLPFLLFAVLLIPGGAVASTKAKTTKDKTKIDFDYVSALAVGNRFLTAWQMRDHEAGLLLLSDEAKRHTTEDQLVGFFSGNGEQRAFLISTGKKIANGRYEFPVGLMRWESSSIHRRFSHILVIRAGKDDWAVDTLP